MIRAMIGTIAVLAGFAVVERTVDASTGQRGTCTPTVAHALLPHGETMPIRDEPTLHSAASGMLEHGEIVRLSGSQGGWARISLADRNRPDGWVPADLLRVDAKAGGALYSLPGPMGRKLAMSDADSGSFRVLGCHGTWLHLINARTGAVWLDKPAVVTVRSSGR